MVDALKVLSDPTLRCRSLAVRILAYNDLFPHMWEQGSWIDIQVRDGGALTGLYLTESMFAKLAIDGRFFDAAAFAAVAEENGHLCKTPGCIAGNGMMLAGERWAYAAALTPSFHDGLFALNWMPGDPRALVDGVQMSLPERALQLLCLDSQYIHSCGGPDTNCPVGEDGIQRHYGSEDLFAGNNNRETVWRLIAAAYGVSEEELTKLVEEDMAECERLLAEAEAAEAEERRAALERAGQLEIADAGAQ